MPESAGGIKGLELRRTYSADSAEVHPVRRVVCDRDNLLTRFVGRPDTKKSGRSDIVNYDPEGTASTTRTTRSRDAPRQCQAIVNVVPLNPRQS